MPLPTPIRQSLSGFGGFLECQVCGSRRPLGDPGSKLERGWPKCCSYTMRWWTQSQIDSGEGPTFDRSH